LAFTLYTKLPANLLGGETAGETGKIDWLSDTIKAALFTTSYTPAQDTDELYSSLTNEVANGNGYTTGGNTCASPTITVTGASNAVAFKASSPSTWTASGAGFTFRYVVIYDSTTSLLIGYDDVYPSSQALAAGDTFTYTLDSNGVFSTTVP